MIIVVKTLCIYLYIFFSQAMLEREQMGEELSALRERFDAAVAEHKATIKDAKNSARQEVRNEITELERRLQNTVSASRDMPSSSMACT